MDPCCGTGTIAKESYNLKIEKGISPDRALESIWASDKSQYPLQLCCMALTNPSSMGQIVQIFNYDVFKLEEGKDIKFIDPNDGKTVLKKIAKMDCIISNLPFVKSTSTEKSGEHIPHLHTSNTSRRMDLFAHIIIHLHSIVKDNGIVGIIVSNSWLSTEWGESFRKKIKKMFHIEMIITSGCGKWFKYTDVATNILILKKKIPRPKDQTAFISTTKPIDKWNDAYIDNVVLNAFSYETRSTDETNCHVLTNSQLKKMEELSIGLSPFFSNAQWIEGVQKNLIKASKLLQIGRGERRGWNSLFYPSGNHTIEREYLKPVLRTMKNVKRYVSQPSSMAFCCSDDIKKLKSKNKTGALSWIKKFSKIKNKKGKSLKETLSRPNHLWYEMKQDTQADIVLGMNPDERIFFARMRSRSFVDQRLIRMTKRTKNTDIQLAHALLNSIFGLYMVESSGFGRGLGVLDLQPKRLNQGLYMLNQHLLSDKDAMEIKKLFKKICLRDVLPLEAELESEDRTQFDLYVLEAFGIKSYYPHIRGSLLDLYRIRKSFDTKHRNKST